MPTVPQYNQFNIPSVSPSDAPDIRGSVTAQAFGAGVGNALAGVGKEIDQLGGVLSENALKMKLLEIQADTDIKTSEWSIEQARLDAAYKELEGKAATEGFEPYVKASRDLREKFSTSMTNPYARKQFDSDSRRFFSYSVRNGAGHAAQQAKKYNTSANAALIGSATQEVIGAPQDNNVFAEAEEIVKRAARQEGINRGWTPQEVEAAQTERTSDLWKARITTLARTDPEGANKMFEENKQKLQPSAAIEVQSQIEKGKQGRLSQGQQVIDQTTQLVQSDLKSIEATGQGVPGLTREKVKLLGPNAADEWTDAQNTAHIVYKNSLDFTYMTPTQIQERVKRFEPTPGAPDYAKQATRYNRIKEIGDQQVWLQATDPALSVGMDPNVKAAAPGSPELFAARIAAQKRAGIQPDDPRGGIGQSPITLDEAKALLDPISRALPGQETKVMDGIIKDAKTKYGEYWQGALSYAFKSVGLQKGVADGVAGALRRAQRGQDAGDSSPESAAAPLMPPAQAPVAPSGSPTAPSGGNVMFGGSGRSRSAAPPTPPGAPVPAPPPAPPKRQKASDRILEGR